MIRFKSILASLAVIVCCVPAINAADATDADGYPVLYVRGAFGNWGCDEAYRFSRTDNRFTITLPALDGDFKISGTDWQINWGAASAQSRYINSSATVRGVHNGDNFAAENLREVTISFAMDSKTSTEDIDITITAKAADPIEGALSGTLPVLYINVYTDESHTQFNNEIISRDLDHKNYFSYAEYWLDTNGCQWLKEQGAEDLGSKDAPLPLEIKARGNWTRRGFSKKPFKLKLKDKQKMLGMTKSKHFALLAHADDSYGYLRNFTGFNLGKRIGLPWTPAQQPVEVVINNNYRGLYFLTESIRIEKNRVNITELDDLVSDPTLASGGYLVELDNYDEDNQIRMEEKSCVGGHHLDMLRITFDTPEEYSDLQRRFVTDQFSAMNDAVGANSNTLWQYLDMDDAARYYIVEEIISHTESFHGSTYLFRDRGEGQKWHLSPLWDCGNAFSGPDNDFFYNHDSYGNTWIPSMRCNEAFNQKVRQTWMWFMTNCYNGIEQDIRQYVDHISAAAIADRNRWRDQPTPEGGQPVVDNTNMAERRDEVLRRLANKTSWLRSQFGDYTTAGTVAEPERDTTPAAPLPEYLSSGVEDITVGAGSQEAPVYYGIDGIRTDNPTPGHLYIEVRGTTARKVIFR